MQNIAFNRILLRDYLPDGSDLDSVLKFTTDPQVAEHSSWGPLSPQEAKDWLQKVIGESAGVARINYQLALVIQATGDLIGNVSLMIRNPISREAEIGYTIRRDLWRQGYATEAAQAITRFAIEDLGMHRVIATTSPGNIGSQRVLEKIGFRKEGYLCKNVLQRGQWRDSLLYALLDDELQKTASSDKH